MDSVNKIDKFIEYININQLGFINTNITFKDITTIKIGGKIKCYYLPRNLDDLIIAFRFIIQEKIPYLVIGKGSNLLVSDREFDVVVINLKNICKIIQVDKNKFIIGAGINNATLSYQLAKIGYTGIEFLSVIPGTIGGSIYMNASAYGSSISDIVKEITYLDSDGKLINIVNKDVNFSYRYSIFQEKKVIITNVLIEVKNLKNNNLPLEKIHTLKNNKKETQPLAFASAGSTFKNGINYNAWEIIDKLGYRGYSENGIMVSKTHTNYLINIKDAKFNDMVNFINKIKLEAKQKYNIDLECEWEIWN